MQLLQARKNFTMEIATKPLIMASEIAGLAPLRAFIKLENQVVPVRFQLAKKRTKHPEFVERVMEQPKIKPEPQISALQEPAKPQPAPISVLQTPLLEPEELWSVSLKARRKQLRLNLLCPALKLLRSSPKRCLYGTKHKGLIRGTYADSEELEDRSACRTRNFGRRRSAGSDTFLP